MAGQGHRTAKCRYSNTINGSLTEGTLIVYLNEIQPAGDTTIYVAAAVRFHANVTTRPGVVFMAFVIDVLARGIVNWRVASSFCARTWCRMRWNRRCGQGPERRVWCITVTTVFSYCRPATALPRSVVGARPPLPAAVPGAVRARMPRRCRANRRRAQPGGRERLFRPCPRNFPATVYQLIQIVMDIRAALPVKP